MNNILINYGVRAGGGPAFLKRTRTAYSYNQLQRQNSSGVTYSQRQQRNGTGYTYVSDVCYFSCTEEPQYSGPGTSYTTSSYCTNTLGNQIWPAYPPCDTHYNQNNANDCYFRPRVFRTCGNGVHQYYYEYGGAYCSWCCVYYDCYGTAYSETVCDISWGGWYNVSSCNTVSPSCSSGAQYVGCQTVTLCYWNVTQSWYNVTSCSASTPSCTNGASRIECRNLTLYDWNAWSEYEEVDICVPQSPAAGSGAVQIECVPQ